MNTASDEGIFYVVFRDENRVSDQNHETKELAQKEADYWNGILLKWPDGSKITIHQKHQR